VSLNEFPIAMALLLSSMRGMWYHSASSSFNSRPLITIAMCINAIVATLAWLYSASAVLSRNRSR